MFQIGTVNTGSLHSWDRPANDNPLPVQFPTPHPNPPSVLTGLNALDIGRHANFRVHAQIKDVRKDGMKINMASWADTVQHSSGCAWLVPPPSDSDFQYGHFCTWDDHPWYNPKRQTTRRIRFTRPYAAPPRVVAWLDMIDVSNKVNCRVHAHVSDVACDAFTLHVDTWADTALYGAGVYWAAHSAGRKDVCSGTFGTGDVRPWSEPRCDNFKTCLFRSANFDKPPRVFLAFNSIDVDRGANLRLKVYTSHLMSAGMIWHIDGWADTVLYSAGVSFIAVP
ncbi:hypothetical protein EIP86_006848 [Pleurotus ostreatoroseus]|nr:hypothetical protein EIP86_006848 [Pleurotus ostreatoroseus]